MESVASPAILIIDLAKHFGGADVRVLELARSLQGNYRYAVATLAGSPLQQRLEAEHLQVLPVPFSRGDPRVLFYLRHLLRAHKFTVLDAHNPQSQFWGALAARIHPTTLVATVHSSYRAEHSASPKGQAYEHVLRLNKLCGAQFIAVSESVHKYLHNLGVPESRLRLIHNSLRAPQSVLSRRNHPLLQSLGWDDSMYVLITVARLEPVKGLTYLIEALRQAVSAHAHIRCLVVGDGRSRAELEKQAHESGLRDHVHFAGFRTDIADLLSASDAFCLASLTEGLPFALLEACLQQLPLLVTEVGGMATLLTHEETAFLVPPADPAALAAGIRWLVEQPQAATMTGQAAYRLCQQRFSPEEMMSKTMEIYQPASSPIAIASDSRRRSTE
jgi:glycosyltransferase involved in cell wall biosynthesis